MIVEDISVRTVTVHPSQDHGLIQTDHASRLADAHVVQVTFPVGRFVATSMFYVSVVLYYQLGKMSRSLDVRHSF